MPWLWWWQMWAELVAANITLVVTPDPDTWRRPQIRINHLRRVK